MNRLRQTFESYLIVRAALDAAERSGEGDANFHGTELDGMHARDRRRSLREGRTELDHLATVGIYAGFEAALRTYVKAQAANLTPLPAAPPPFVENLVQAVAERSSGLRMKEVRRLFTTTVGAFLAGEVGQIEDYRNWVAHGREGPNPRTFDPRDTYVLLTNFLSAVGAA